MSVMEKLTAIADAIRGKTGGTEALTLDQMATEIAGIEAGSGGEWSTDGIASATEPTGSLVLTCSKIANYAFVGRPITGITSTTVTEVGNYVLENCYTLAKLELPNVVKCGTKAFAGVQGQMAVIFPLLTSAGNQLFQDSKILSADLPSLESCPASLFQGCSKMTTVNVPKLTTAGTYAFSYCAGLSVLDLPAVTAINQGAFMNSTNLATIILRSADGATLSNVNAFTGTPFASGGTGGTIYVPQALIDSGFYTTATNWSAVDGYGTITWAAIEGSEYE